MASLHVFSSAAQCNRQVQATACALQVFTSIDGVIDKFKRQPVPPEIAQAAPVHQPDVYQQHPAAAAAAYPAAQPAAYPAAQYAAPAYNAGAYPNAQYAAYLQQQYQQPYAAAANGTHPSQGKS